MSLDSPVAVATVRFNHLTGQQVAALVQRVAGDNLVAQHRYYDGDAVILGQRTSYPYEHILVAPSHGPEAFLFEDHGYSEVKVMSHNWGGTVYAIGYDDKTVIEAVKKFADELTVAYQLANKNGFPEYVEPGTGNG